MTTPGPRRLGNKDNEGVTAHFSKLQNRSLTSQNGGKTTMIKSV